MNNPNIDKRVLQWLFDNGSPVIRYRVASMFGISNRSVDGESLEHELLNDKAVNKWLNNLKSYEYMSEQRMLGKGLGMGGSSSFLHGSKNMNLEVVLPKLGQLGLHAGMSVLDKKTISWRSYLESELQNVYNKEYLDDSEFHHKVYSHHDHRLIIASSLALAGYITDEAVRKVVYLRINAIFEAVKTGSYDIYEKPGDLNIRPKKWENHILKREYYPDGNIRLPFIHDICAFASIYKYTDHVTKNQIDTIINWILSPEYKLLRNYAYIRYPSGRGKHVGDNMNFTDDFDSDMESFAIKSLVLRCWQMAHFPSARNHSWFRKSINHLNSFITDRGTYIFPSIYLNEISDGGKWIYGLHMGLGENRHSANWRELESTFWMMAIWLAMSDIE